MSSNGELVGSTARQDGVDGDGFDWVNGVGADDVAAQWEQILAEREARRSQ